MSPTLCIVTGIWRWNQRKRKHSPPIVGGMWRRRRPCGKSFFGESDRGVRGCEPLERGDGAGQGVERLEGTPEEDIYDTDVRETLEQHDLDQSMKQLKRWQEWYGHRWRPGDVGANRPESKHCKVERADARRRSTHVAGSSCNESTRGVEVAHPFVRSEVIEVQETQQMPRTATVAPPGSSMPRDPRRRVRCSDGPHQQKETGPPGCPSGGSQSLAVRQCMSRRGPARSLKKDGTSGEVEDHPSLGSRSTQRPRC